MVSGSDFRVGASGKPDCRRRMIPERVGQTAAMAARWIAWPVPFLTGTPTSTCGAVADFIDRPVAAAKQGIGLTLNECHSRAPALNIEDRIRNSVANPQCDRFGERRRLGPLICIARKTNLIFSGELRSPAKGWPGRQFLGIVIRCDERCDASNACRKSLPTSDAPLTGEPRGSSISSPTCEQESKHVACPSECARQNRGRSQPAMRPSLSL
jgi:hypothetical protein